jgi:hypothetical protein
LACLAVHGRFLCLFSIKWDYYSSPAEFRTKNSTRKAAGFWDRPLNIAGCSMLYAEIGGNSRKPPGKTGLYCVNEPLEAGFMSVAVFVSEVLLLCYSVILQIFEFWLIIFEFSPLIFEYAPLFF